FCRAVGGSRSRSLQPTVEPFAEGRYDAAVEHGGQMSTTPQVVEPGGRRVTASDHFHFKAVGPGQKWTPDNLVQDDNNGDKRCQTPGDGRKIPCICRVL